MTVKDVFDLRKQGRIEEAYEAIRPMYAAHKGRYTTLCMFWTASDIFKLRMEQGRIDEAEKIYRALQRILPHVQEIERQLQEERGTKADNDTDSALVFMDYASHCLESVESAECTQRFDRCEEESSAQRFSCSESPDQCAQRFDRCEAPTEATGSNPEHTPLSPEPSHNHEPHTDDGNNMLSEKTAPETELLTLHSPLSTLDISPLVLLPADEKDEGEAPQQVVDVHSVSGLSAMQRIVLGFIAANPGSDLPLIAHGLGLLPQHVEPHLAALTARGLVTQASTGYFVKQ